MERIFTILIISCFTFALHAQHQEDDRRNRMERRIESKKIGFITNELDLSTEEAQLFWPIYNEFYSKMKAIREESKSLFEENKNIESKSDDDAIALINIIFDKEQEELNLKRSYYQKFEKAISVKKVARLFLLEKRFRTEILKTIKEKMKGRKNKRKGRF